jgi:hypothetical protein
MYYNRYIGKVLYNTFNIRQARHRGDSNHRTLTCLIGNTRSMARP